MKEFLDPKFHIPTKTRQRWMLKQLQSWNLFTNKEKSRWLSSPMIRAFGQQMMQVGEVLLTLLRKWLVFKIHPWAIRSILWNKIFQQVFKVFKVARLSFNQLLTLCNWPMLNRLRATIKIWRSWWKLLLIFNQPKTIFSRMLATFENTCKKMNN